MFIVGLILLYFRLYFLVIFLVKLVIFLVFIVGGVSFFMLSLYFVLWVFVILLRIFFIFIWISFLILGLKKWKVFFEFNFFRDDVEGCFVVDWGDVDNISFNWFDVFVDYCLESENGFGSNWDWINCFVWRSFMVFFVNNFFVEYVSFGKKRFVFDIDNIVW